MPQRKKIPESIQAMVLLRSRRRCCICFALNDEDDVKKGQIVHLDQDPANSEPDNLAFLCFKHHDEYDGRTSQSKGFLTKEVKDYREMLYSRYRDETTATEVDFDEELSLRFWCSDPPPGLSWPTDEEIVTASVGDVFRIVGPLMIDECPEHQLYTQLRTAYISTPKGISIFFVHLDDEDFQRAKLKLFSMGLIEPSSSPRAQSSDYSHWKLTPKGTKHLIGISSRR